MIITTATSAHTRILVYSVTCPALSQVAAATGFQVWEGARAVLKLLKDAESPLCTHIKGKRVLELGSGTGLAGLCASVIGADVILSGIRE